MALPETWNDFTSANDRLPATSLRELRPGDETVWQYSKEAEGFLAVHSTTPYGDQTDTAFDDPARLHLLEGVYRGEDYTVFRIPQELLSLSGLTVGNGRQHRQELVPIYRQVGALIRETGIDNSSGLPLVTVEDFGYDRRNKIPVLLPPLRFSEFAKYRRAPEYVRALGQSLLQNFEENVANLFASAVQEGLGMYGTKSNS